jgi:hypothetical protein
MLPTGMARRPSKTCCPSRLNQASRMCVSADRRRSGRAAGPCGDAPPAPASWPLPRRRAFGRTRRSPLPAAPRYRPSDPRTAAPALRLTGRRRPRCAPPPAARGERRRRHRRRARRGRTRAVRGGRSCRPPHVVGERRGHQPQHVVADRRAGALVDAVEAVDVEDDQTEFSAWRGRGRSRARACAAAWCGWPGRSGCRYWPPGRASRPARPGRSAGARCGWQRRTGRPAPERVVGVGRIGGSAVVGGQQPSLGRLIAHVVGDDQWQGDQTRPHGRGERAMSTRCIHHRRSRRRSRTAPRRRLLGRRALTARDWSSASGSRPALGGGQQHVGYRIEQVDERSRCAVAAAQTCSASASSLASSSPPRATVRAASRSVTWLGAVHHGR